MGRRNTPVERRVIDVLKAMQRLRYAMHDYKTTIDQRKQVMDVLQSEVDLVGIDYQRPVDFKFDREEVGDE